MTPSWCGASTADLYIQLHPTLAGQIPQGWPPRPLEALEESLPVGYRDAAAASRRGVEGNAGAPVLSRGPAFALHAAMTDLHRSALKPSGTQR